MVSRERQHDFKIVLLAIARHNATGEKFADIIDALIDIDNQIKPVGDSVWNYWPSAEAVRKFNDRNDEEIGHLSEEFADSDQEYAKAFFGRYIYGGEIKEGGSEEDATIVSAIRTVPEATTDHEPDAAYKRREDRRFVADCLTALVMESGGTPDPVVIARYAESIVVGRQ